MRGRWSSTLIYAALSACATWWAFRLLVDPQPPVVERWVYPECPPEGALVLDGQVLDPNEIRQLLVKDEDERRNKDHRQLDKR